MMYNIHMGATLEGGSGKSFYQETEFLFIQKSLMGNLSGREDTFMLTTELFIAITGLCFGCLGFGFTIGYAFGKISNKNIR